MSAGIGLSSATAGSIVTAASPIGFWIEFRRPEMILEMPTLPKVIRRTSPIQICHPERSALNSFPNDSDRREVEGSREYFKLTKRFKAFSREFPVAELPIEASSGCFDSRSLTLALAQ